MAEPPVARVVGLFRSAAFSTPARPVGRPPSGSNVLAGEVKLVRLAALELSPPTPAPPAPIPPAAAPPAPPSGAPIASIPAASAAPDPPREHPPVFVGGGPPPLGPLGSGLLVF